MYNFSEKIVLITGGAGSIGAELCKAFANGGAKVIALDNRPDRLETLVKQAKEVGHDYYTIHADTTHFEEVQKKVGEAQKAVGPVDILVNNAGWAFTFSLATTTYETWMKDIELNLNGHFNCVEAVRSQMIERKKGVIINIGSVNAFEAFGNPAYSAAKAGLINYTKALAMEFSKFGIRSNIICLGTVKTLGWEVRLKKEPHIFEPIKKRYPQNGRIVGLEDVANITTFLASDLAKAIDGAAITVDGGLMAGSAAFAHELTLEDF